MPKSPISNRTLEQLEQALISFSERLNGMEYEQLLLIREFDIRQGWRAWHFNNCAEWLNFKCGIAIATAREKVRVARALFDLPECSHAFSDGKLSYSKARSLTRIADAATEKSLLAFALPATASQVDEHCQQIRNAQRRQSTKDANRAHQARYFSRSIHGDGSMTISVQLPREAADLVMKAIDIAVELDANAKADEATFVQQQADALVEVARGFLAGGGDNPSSTADHYQVMVHVDESALVASQTSQISKSDLPIESVRRILCDASMVPMAKDKNGNPLNLGRKQRVVSPPLKRALIGRDRHCAYPSCTHDKWLDAHHIEHWVDGGETSLANTILICSTHHRLLHEGGYTIQKDYEGNWSFRTSAGKIIPNAPVFTEGYYDEPSVNPPRGGLEREPGEQFVRELVPIYQVHRVPPEVRCTITQHFLN